MSEIVLECKPDEALVRALGFPRKVVTHQSSRGEVINYLKRNPKALGLIDDDPGSAKPSYFFKFHRETAEQFSIESFHLPKQETRLIVIKPRLEEWILKYARDSNVDPKKYFLPTHGHELHKIINTQLVRFDEMLLEMLSQKSTSLQYLKKLVSQSIKM